MAARPDETGDDGEAQEVVPVDDRKFAELIAIQRERNELVARALDIDQQEIQLSYEYDSKELEVQNEQNKRAHRLVQQIFGGFGVVVLLLLYMAFFGNDDQSGKAMKMLSEGAKALGGAGFIFLIYSGLKRLINR